MINQFTMAVYNLSPVRVQNLFCTWAGRRYEKLRYGGEYDRWREFYAESRNWSEAELKEYQREQLGLLVREAFDRVPYYAERWKQAGVGPDDIRGPEDLPKLPFVTKEDIFDAGDAMLASGTDKKRMFCGMTGGSTGMPLVRYFTPEEVQRHYAIWWDRLRQGAAKGQRYATFQGKEIVPSGQSRPPYWRQNRASNQVLYSMRHLSPEKLHCYAENLMAEQFAYYQGYVSIMSVVAQFMSDNGLKLPTPPKAVFTTSEQLTNSERKLFEEAWQTKVWNEYNQGERCSMIVECPAGNHHVQMDYGVVEYEPIGREGDLLLAEIICTGFIPHAGPLIRYRIGDRVLVDENAVCNCGRPGPVIKAIRGRISDYILLPDGRKYPHVSLIVDMLHNVRRTQVVQDRPDEIIVRIVKFPQYTQADEQHLIHCFQERIGGGIKVIPEYVEALERRPNGKVMSIINRIPGHGRGGSADAD